MSTQQTLLLPCAWRPPVRRAFTLVELLVVIFIVGVLIAILLPAIQAAREVARNMQCKSNLTQIAKAIQLSESSSGHLPTGGWHPQLHGTRGRGTGRHQPGSWWWCILPYIEMAHAQEYTSSKCYNEALLRNPLAACPTRGLGPTFPAATNGDPSFQGALTLDGVPVNADSESGSPIYLQVPRSDYAANGGDFHPGNSQGMGSPPPGSNVPLISAYADPDLDWFWEWNRPQSARRGEPIYDYNGVIFQQSEIRDHQIKDGRSQVYLVGEKSVQSRIPGSPYWWTPGDTRYTIFAGSDYHIIRFGRRATGGFEHGPGVPVYNNGKKGDDQLFGSSHTGGCNMAMCDGSVHVVSFNVDPEVHRAQSNRHDSSPATPLPPFTKKRY